MKKMKFWLEVVENDTYRQVEIITEQQETFIRFLDNQNLGKNTKDIVLKNATTTFTSKYFHIVGYEALGNKTYALKGYYLYTLKPYIKKEV